MKINRIDHISIAVRDLNQARRVWEPVLGRTAPDEEYVDENEQIRVARYRLGEVAFELMASTSPNGEVARFIEKRGEGVMLISFNVGDTRRAIAELQDGGYAFIPDQRGELARPFRDGEFAFIHPRQLTGVLTEVIDGQESDPASGPSADDS